MLTPADILVARRRIAGIAYPTPLEHSRSLSAQAGVEVTLVLPESASPAKVEALRRYPATVLRIGASYDEAEAAAVRLSTA